MNTYCADCDEELLYYDHEIISDDKGTLQIRYFGHCPCCHKRVEWVEKYQFVETIWAKEI